MPDQLDALGSAVLRAALLVIRRARGPVSIDEAAQTLGVHRNVARSRLERLAEAGLLDTTFERRTGRSGPGAGRPSKAYAPAPELSAIEYPERRYADLVGLLLEEVSDERLREVGEAFGRKLAREAGVRPAKRVRAGLEKACEAVRKLGFQASVEEDGVIRTPTCPLRPLVVSDPRAVDVDRGMWAGLVAASIEGVEAAEIICETQDCGDDHSSCRVYVQLRRGGDGDAAS